MTYEEEFGEDDIHEDQLSLTTESDEPKYIVYLDPEDGWKYIESPNGHLTLSEARDITKMKNKTNILKGINLNT